MGLTQEQLAERLGVERSTVVRWERGQTQPQPWLRPRLAKTLGVSADRIEKLLADGGAPARPQGRAVALPRQLQALHQQIQRADRSLTAPEPATPSPGAEPGGELREVHRQLPAGDPSLARPGIPRFLWWFAPQARYSSAGPRS